jgi:hypothetical protein
MLERFIDEDDSKFKNLRRPAGKMGAIPPTGSTIDNWLETEANSGPMTVVGSAGREVNYDRSC